jgi:hypothetical protein
MLVLKMLCWSFSCWLMSSKVGQFMFDIVGEGIMEMV